jgi:hypothetical protein
MSVSSPCEVCGKPQVEHSCDRCASLVCANHFDTETGLCAECQAQVGGGERRQGEEDLPDGVDTYRF